MSTRVGWSSEKAARVVYFLFCASLGSLLPFVPVFLAASEGAKGPTDSSSDLSATAKDSIDSIDSIDSANSLSLSPRALGLSAALVPAATVLTIPLISRLADRLRRPRLVFGWTAAIAALARLSLILSLTADLANHSQDLEQSNAASSGVMGGPMLLLLIAGALHAPCAALLDHIVLAAAPHPTHYGPIRMAGSIGFGLAAALAAALLPLDTPLAFWLVHVVPLLAALSLLPKLRPQSTSTLPLHNSAAQPHGSLPSGSGSGSGSASASSSSVSMSASASTPTASLNASATSGLPSSSISSLSVSTSTSAMGAGAAGLPSPSPVPRHLRITSASGVLFLAAIAWCGFLMAAIETFALLYLAKLHTPAPILGIALFMACAGEVPSFLYASHAIRRVGHHGVLLLALIAYVVRLAALAGAPVFGPLLVIVAQPLHGITFALLWAAGIDYMQRIDTANASSSMVALLNAVFWGLGGALGNFLCGIMFEEIGPDQMYKTLSQITFLIMLIFWYFVRKYRLTETKHEHE